MKTVFIIFTILALYSCKKCADCETVTTTEVTPATPGYPKEDKTTFEACGEDLKDINESPIVTTSTTMGITVKVTSVTTCN